MLYIIKQYPVDPATLKKTTSGDTVILTENAVLAAKRDTLLNSHSFIKKTFTHINLCVLKDDLKIKGISTQDLAQGISILDNQDFKYITRQDEAIRSWN